MVILAGNYYCNSPITDVGPVSKNEANFSRCRRNSPQFFLPHGPLLKGKGCHTVIVHLLSREKEHNHEVITTIIVSLLPTTVTMVCM